MRRGGEGWRSNRWDHGTDGSWGSAWQDWSRWRGPWHWPSEVGAEEGAAAAAAAFSAAAAAEEDAVGTVGFRPAGQVERASENGVEVDKRTAPRPTEMEGHQGGRGGRGSPAPQGLAAAAAAPGSATGARAGFGFAQAYASGAAVQQEYWDRNKHYPYSRQGVQGFWVWEPNEETWMWMPRDEYAEWPGNRLMTDEGINSARLDDH